MTRVEFLRREAEMLRRRAEQARLMGLNETRGSYLRRANRCELKIDMLEERFAALQRSLDQIGKSR